MSENQESFQNLHDNLAEYGIKQGSIPIVIQYNKRDLPNALPVETIDKTLNRFGYPWNEAVANQGKGVFESLKIIGKIVIDSLNRKYSRPASAQSSEPAQRTQTQTQPQQPLPTQKRVLPEPSFSAPARPLQQSPASSQHRSAPSDENIFQASQSQQEFRPQVAPQGGGANPQPRDDFYDYGQINLEPMSPPSQAQPAAAPAESGVDKTELDLEIEKYQKEIEDKQRRLRTLQSSTSAPLDSAAGLQGPSPRPQPQPKQQTSFPAPQKANYDVYDLPETDDQIPQFPPQGQDENSHESSIAVDEEQPLYFTSVNTGQRKKTKRPVNPKTKQQSSFLSKFFNKDKPQ